MAKEDALDFLSKYSKELSNQNHIDMKYKCTICKNILINAHSIPCGCTFCEKCIRNYLKDEIKTCPSNKSICLESSFTISDIAIAHKKNYKLNLLTVKCPSNTCDFKATIKEMPNHMSNCTSKYNCIFTDWGCNDDVDIKSIKEHIKENVSDHLLLTKNYIESINNKLKSFQLEIDKLKKENENLKIQMKIEYLPNEGIVWKIDNFDQKRITSLNTRDSVFSCKPFYIMECQFYLDFWPSGKNKDGSIQIDLISTAGIYDDSIIWPYNHVIKVELINQCNGEVFVEVNTSGKTFRRDNNSNITFANFDNFVTFDQLKNNFGLIHNDSILIKCYLLNYIFN